MGSIRQLAEDRVYDEEEEEDADELAGFLSEDEEELDIEGECPALDETFPNSLFICNVPSVDQNKYDKLMSVLGKLIDKHGENEKYMPINPSTGKTDGFLIVTFQSKNKADDCALALDGASLDRNHVFKVVKLDRYDEIISRQEKFAAKNPLQTFSREDFRDWLADKQCREQFLLRYQAETEIYWHDTLAGTPTLCYGGEREKRNKKIWCDWKVQWSPLGSYLATFHAQGIALWAGPEFTKKMRIPHESVKHIEFSPTEDYILTWNGSTPQQQDDNAVRIFRVMTGETMKKCRTPTKCPLDPAGEWPYFLWSHDGQYYAECNESSITVRDTVTFDIIKDEEGKKKRFNFDGLDVFQWSPKDNIIAAWMLEKNNNPARLVLVEIPSRKELASRSRTAAKGFAQVEASMKWQSEGDYLCVLVTKLSKAKKKGATNLEIFRIRERNIPVEIVEVKDTVRGFYWETKGNRFCVQTSDETGHHPKLWFYHLAKDKCENICCFDLPSNSFSNLYWAPDGQYFLCAAEGHGDLLFGGLTPDNKLEILHKDEHFMLTDVQCDPSSRYWITAVTQPMRDEMCGFKYQMEAGYNIWTFQGRCLHKQQLEKLYHVSWRPHPPSLLSSDKQREIRQNIKKFSKKYDMLDDQAKESARTAFRQERNEKMMLFRDVLDRLEEYKADKIEDHEWERYLVDYEWSKTEDMFEDELDTVEELISGN